MILTAHQPSYLPWLGLFHKMALADVFVFYDHVQFQTEEFNHRNKIKTPSGSLWLTVEVGQRGYLEQTMMETVIQDSKPWRRKHLRSLTQNYQKAPYFDHYTDFFREMYSKPWKSLVELNFHQLKWFARELGIETSILRGSELDLQGQKSDMALDMCQKLNANLFIFGAQGVNYADRDSFADASVKIMFQDYKHPVYPQLYGDFVSHLSIIDLLFNCGPDSLEILMSGNLERSDLRSI
jgi:hypothetical protein